MPFRCKFEFGREPARAAPLEWLLHPSAHRASPCHTERTGIMLFAFRRRPGSQPRDSTLSLTNDDILRLTSGSSGKQKDLDILGADSEACIQSATLHSLETPEITRDAGRGGDVVACRSLPPRAQTQKRPRSKFVIVHGRQTARHGVQHRVWRHPETQKMLYLDASILILT